MAQIVKLRRSSVSGQKPTNSNLQLGELALNTTDGKVYMAVSGSGGPSIEELISTNTVNTGSIFITDNVTASFFTGSFIGDGSQLINIPSSGVTGLELNKIISGSVSASISPDRGLEINTDVTISGSFPPGSPSASLKVYGNTEIDGYAKFTPVSATLDTSTTGSYIFVSGSTDDLYFSQNGKGYSNVTRLRWLEGNLYSGLLNGGAISATTGSTTFNVAAGSGIIVNLNASLIDNPYPTIKYVNWNTFTGQTLTHRTTHIQTFLAINADGDIVQSTTPFVATQYNTLITLGTVIHQNLSTVNASITYPNVAYGYKQRSYDFLKAFGPLKLSGLNLITTGSLGLNVGSGTAFADGRNYQTDPNNPSYITDSGTAVSKIFRYYQVSGTTFVQDTNNGAGYSVIDPTKYVLNGVLTNVGGDYSIQRVFWYPNSATKGIVVYYGNAKYSTIREAIDNINVETFNETENTKQNAVLIGTIIISGNGDFTNSQKYSILPAGLFRSIGGSGGGGNIPTSRLFDLSDVDTTNQQDHDLLVYNSDTLKWEPKKSLGGSYSITGSLNVIGGLTGSIDYSNLTNVPTLVSGSSQIEITGTTGYSTFSSSISTSIGELSSSIATTTNDLDGRLDSIEGVTGSYATTGSNQFNGDQSISGSVNIGSGSLDSISPEVLHVGNSGSYNIARFDGYDNNYAQINVKNHHSGSGASTDFVLTADNGTETIHYVDLGINSSNYNAGYVGRENDAYLLNAGKDLYVGTIGGAGHPSNLNLFAQNKWESPQIRVSGSGQVLFNTLTIAAGYEYEFSGSINANHDLNVEGNISGSNITGSFIGDGSGLYNIPASGVTGLELNKIIDGSVSASILDGALRVNSDVFIDGVLTANELHIDYVTSSVLYQSGSTKFGDTIDDTHNFTGSVYIDGDLNVDSITGSIDFSNLTNLPTLVSGSSQISYSGITDVPTNIVSGSPQISYTGITDVPNGIVSGSPQINDLGFTTTSSFQSFTSSYIQHSASFDIRINNVTGSFDAFTSSVVLTTQTSSMTVLSASYAATASYALNAAGAGVEGKSAKLTQSISSSTWTFDHFLGEKYPNVTVYDSNDQIVVPTYIEAVSDTQLVIYFSIAQTGTAVATIGGGLPAISGSYEGRVLSVVDGAGSWKEGIVSSSLQIVEAGFATTGSNTFFGDQQISGSLIIENAKIGAHVITITSTTEMFNLGAFDGAHFDYVVKSGPNKRAGNIAAVWNNTDSVFNETSTVDLGTTDGVNFDISSNGIFSAVVTSGTWTVEVLYRALGGTSITPPA